MLKIVILLAITALLAGVFVRAASAGVSAAFDLRELRPSGGVYDINAGHGKFFVPDLSNGMVVVLSKDLQREHIIRGVLSPHTVAVGPDGFIYIGQHRSNGIRKFSAEFTEVIDWDKDLREHTKAPVAIEAGLNNNLYVCDWLMQRVIEVTTDGKFVRAFEDAPIKAKAEFQAHGIAVDAKNRRVYIADRGNEGGNGTIHTFSLDGKFIKSWLKPSADFDPFTVRRLADGLYMVPNYKDGALYVFDPDGNLLDKVELLGETPGKFQYMTSAVADDQGFVYGSEIKGNRIQKIDLRPVIKRLKNR